MKDKGLFTADQHGFMEGKSCLTNDLEILAIEC